MRRPEVLPSSCAGAAAAIAAGLLLAGCALGPRALPPPLPAPPTVIEVPAPPPPPLDLVGYAQKLRALPAGELQAETQAQLDLAQGAEAGLARLKAAIALAQPQHPARDDQRAAALAQEVAQDAAGSVQLRDAAALVALWLEEQRRGDTVTRRAQSRAREDELRIQALEQRLRDTERRAAEAEKKLEALRAIERDLSGRAAGNGRGSGAAGSAP